MPPEDSTHTRRLSLAEALRSSLELPAEMSGQEIVDAIGPKIVDGVLAKFDEEDQRVVTTAKRLAAAGRATEAPPPSAVADPEILLEWAQATGRIAASSRPHWERTLAASREHTDALIRVLAPTPTVQASAPQVRPAWTPQTASGLDVSRLPARLQAAAAAEADRGKVYRWVERYSGMSDDEVAPMGLRLEGETDLAADVERRENEARVEAMHALNSSIESNNALYQAQLAEEHQRRMRGQ